MPVMMVPNETGHEHGTKKVYHDSNNEGLEKSPSRRLTMLDMIRLSRVFWLWLDCDISRGTWNLLVVKSLSVTLRFQR